MLTRRRKKVSKTAICLKCWPEGARKVSKTAIYLKCWPEGARKVSKMTRWTKCWPASAGKVSKTAICLKCWSANKKLYVFVTFIIVKLPMPAADIRISGARIRMDMLPDYFEAAATSKNWKIALQLKLRNFCLRPARRIIDTGRASYVWAERAEAHKMVEFSPKIHSLPRVIFDKNCFKMIC